MVWSEFLRMIQIFMDSCGFIYIGYDFYALVLILEIVLDLNSLDTISMRLPGFQRLGLDVYGLVLVATSSGN